MSEEKLKKLHCPEDYTAQWNVDLQRRSHQISDLQSTSNLTRRGVAYDIMNIFTTFLEPNILCYNNGQEPSYSNLMIQVGRSENRALKTDT